MPHPDYEVKLKEGTLTWDPSILFELREFVDPEELADGYTPEHEETVLVADSWNMTKIKKLMKQQKVKDYWSLHYVNETMRYVPRIIAAKEIFSQPERYLGLPPDDFYVPLDTEIVTVRVKKSLRHLASIAKEYGTYYRELKLLNPEIRRSYLPRGTHKIKIPKRSCPANCPNHDHAP